MSNQGPPPPHEPLIDENRRPTRVWHAWFLKFAPLLDSIDALIESLQTGLAGAGNVSATSTFPTANNVLITETANTRNITPSTVWTIESGTSKFVGTKTGSTSADVTTFEIRSEFQAAFYPTAYGAVATAFLGGRRARGTMAAPAAIQTNDALFNIGGLGSDGTAGTVDGFSGTFALLSCRAAENWSTTGKGTYWAMFTTPVGSVAGQVERLRVEDGGHTRPGADNSYNLGTESQRWKEVFAANATINTSDARLKEITGTLGFAGRFVDAVEPIMFRWISGATDVIPDPSGALEPNPAGDIDDHGNPVMQPRMIEVDVPGRRNHAGWRAQDIKAAMDAEGIDFSAWGLDDKDDPNSRQWTRPGELTAVLWEALRQTRAEVETLKSRISQLEGNA